MKRKAALFVGILLTVSACMLTAQPQVSAPVTQALKPVIPAALRSPDLLKSLNKQVTVEGFYYAGSIPMVIDDITRTYVNLPLPTDSYVPLVGARPAGIKSGDKIKVTGLLRRPAPGDPNYVIGESAIIAGRTIHKITPTNLDRIKLTTPASILREGLSNPTIDKIKALGPDAMRPARKFAVLIAGGASYASNHIRYWNDTLCMYRILRENGYPADNIKVLYHDGFEPVNSVEGKVSGTMPIHYSARRPNIAKVFDDLAATMTENDSLFIMINNHGGGLLTKASGSYSPGMYGGRFDTSNELTEDLISEGEFDWDFNNDGDKADAHRVDECFYLGPTYGAMYDDDFAAEVNKIQDYAVMIIVMEQCFSGGFIDDLRAPNRIVMSAASPNQISRARWPKSGVAVYNEFTYWYFTVLMGKTPDDGPIKNPEGRVVGIDADFDENGRISMQEAFNWARRMDKTDEHPHYDDNAFPPSVTGFVPYSMVPGNEGFVGSRTFL